MAERRCVPPPRRVRTELEPTQRSAGLPSGTSRDPHERRASALIRRVRLEEEHARALADVDATIAACDAELAERAPTEPCPPWHDDCAPASQVDEVGEL